jgi:hypothetical protein
MGRSIGQITPSGAILQVKVMASSQRVDWLKANGLPFPSPYIAKALIDTGASSTCLDDDIVVALGLDYSGSTLVHTPSTMGVGIQKYTYDVSVVFGDGQKDPRTFTRELVGTELRSQGIDLLIGRDILAKCILNYDGPNGIFKILF